MSDDEPTKESYEACANMLHDFKQYPFQIRGMQTMKWEAEFTKTGHKPRLKLAWDRSCQPAWICEKCLKRLADIEGKCTAP